MLSLLHKRPCYRKLPLILLGVTLWIGIATWNIKTPPLAGRGGPVAARHHQRHGQLQQNRSHHLQQRHQQNQSPQQGQHKECPPSAPPTPPGSQSFLIPNVIHFTHLKPWLANRATYSGDLKLLMNDGDIHFVTMICILSALFNHRPDKILVHTNYPLDVALAPGHRLARLVRAVGGEGVLEVRSGAVVPPDVELFEGRGRRNFSSVFHANDYFRILLLMEHGGISLDTDMFVVRSLDELRRHETSLGLPLFEPFGAQFIATAPNSTFIRMYRDSYRKDYKPHCWYCNAGEIPTETILRPCPGIFHREKELLGVAIRMIKSIFDKAKPGQEWWKNYYALHLLYRHRSYLSAPGDYEAYPEINETNIEEYPGAFGEMSRPLLRRLEEIEKRQQQ